MTNSSSNLIIKPGLAVVISSPSGTGKTTICHQLIEKYNIYQFSVSATTRPPRGQEQNGVDYVFLSEADFLKARNNNEFIETAQYLDKWYGTPRKPLEEAIAKGRIVLLDIDIQGGRSIGKVFPGAISIFLIPPSLDELKRRLTDRRTEDEAAIAKRLRRALIELKAWNEYDYVVVNDELDKAVDDINNIVQTEQMKTKRLDDKMFWNKKINELLGLE